MSYTTIDELKQALYGRKWVDTGEALRVGVGLLVEFGDGREPAVFHAGRARPVTVYGDDLLTVDGREPLFEAQYEIVLDHERKRIVPGEITLRPIDGRAITPTMLKRARFGVAWMEAVESVAIRRGSVRKAHRAAAAAQAAVAAANKARRSLDADGERRLVGQLVTEAANAGKRQPSRIELRRELERFRATSPGADTYPVTLNMASNRLREARQFGYAPLSSRRRPVD